MLELQSWSFRASFLMSLELVYGCKASDLFLTEPHIFEMLCNPGKRAWTSGGKLRDSNLISSIQIPVQHTILHFNIVINCILENFQRKAFQYFHNHFTWGNRDQVDLLET